MTMTETPAPVALITGGARRIGAEIAQQLHRAGYRVLIHYRESAKEADALCAALNQQRPDCARSLKADLAELSAIGDLAKAVETAWGRLDLLVNNASAFYPTPLGEVTQAIWNDLLASNLSAPFFISQALAPLLKKEHGCIINIVDIHAQRPLKNHTVYCAAKAGNLMLTQSLALELAPEVRVNGIAPGAILWPESTSATEASVQQTTLEKIPLRRCGTAADIARTLLFLAQDAPYITGQIIAVDGGRSLNQ